MDKKITRRVVLGAGLVALAAGPFAIKALRKDGAVSLDWEEVPLFTTNDLPVPPPFPSRRTDFFNEWKALQQHFLPLGEEKDHPREVSLSPRLSTEKSWSFIKVNTHIHGDVADIGAFTATADSAKPMYYEVIEGSIFTGRDRLVASVSKNELLMVVPKADVSQRSRVETDGDRVVSVKYDYSPVDEIKVNTRVTGSVEFEVRDDIFGVPLPQIHPAPTVVGQMEAEKILLLNSLYSAVRFLYLGDYSLGQKHEVPANAVLFFGWSDPRIQVLDAVKKSGERLIAVVSGEQTFGSDQLRSYYHELIQASLEQMEPKNLGDVDEALRRETEMSRRQMVENLHLRVEQTVEQEKSRHTKETWHVDVETGLVLKYERSRRPFDVVNGFTAFEQFRMIES
jgi:hypothetical protein